MMKYILHGGGSRVSNKNNGAFFDEVFKGFKNPKLLVCLFAHEESRWVEDEKKIKERFIGSSNQKEIEFIIASKNIEEFIQQVKSADAIYIHGGREFRIKEIFDKIENLSELFEGKTVAGSSAGADIFGKYYYTGDFNRVEQGYGILSIKIFCHFESEAYDINYPKALDELKNYGEDLPVYTLRETEFVVFEV